MKKRIFSVIMAFCVALTLFPAYAARTADAAPEPDAEAPGFDAETAEPESAALQAANISWPVEGGRLLFDATTGTIVGYTGELTDLEIPSEIYGVAVTTIGQNAFQDCYSLTSVVIPDSVTTIEGSDEEGYSYWSDYYHCYGGAFSYCGRLTHITIPDTVTDIGKGCFQSCSSLETIRLPKKITAISNALFMKCTALTNVEIPEGVTYIGRHAFHGCVKLSNLNFPNRLTNFGESAFYDCDSLTSVVIPDGVTYITGGGMGERYGSFQDCSSLTTLTIPASLTSIQYQAFSGCPVTDIYYYGSITQWLNISVGEYNHSIAAANLHFLLPKPTISFSDTTGGKLVEIASGVSDAEIHYTLDGSEPTTDSTLYTKPFTVTDTVTVRAVNVLNGTVSEDSKVTVEVPRCAMPAANPDNSQSLPAGIRISLISSTPGSAIYYTLNGSQPDINSTRYAGEFSLLESATVKAFAVRDGYGDSEIFTAEYDILDTREPVVISVASASGTARPGEPVRLPVSIQAEDDITGFAFYIRYPWQMIERLSFEPRSGLGVTSSSEESGLLKVTYQGDPISVGTVGNLVFHFVNSVYDGEYTLTIPDGSGDETAYQPSVTTTAGVEPRINTAAGTVAIAGSYNSRLTTQVNIKSATGDTLTAEDLQSGVEIKPEIIVQENAASLRTVNIFLAIYDRDGHMTDLQVWEIDLSKPASFVQSRTIPPGIEAGTVKIMVLDDALIPLMAAQSL